VPVIIPTIIPSQIGNSQFVIIIPVATAETVIMVPTERSIPPVIITKVAPKARTPFTVAASKIPFTFGIVKKFSEAIEKKITISTKEPKAKTRWIASDLIVVILDNETLAILCSSKLSS
jgi:hypothetical protein